MDSNPNSQTKSASRLGPNPHPQQQLSLSPPPPSLLPLQDLLLLSPSPSPSPVRKSRTRLADRFDMDDDPVIGSRRRCKTRGSHQLSSPRTNRRSRRKSEIDIREDKDVTASVDDVTKLRRKKHSVRLKKDKLSLVPYLVSSPKMDDDGGQGNLDRFGLMLADLVTWRDVAKSSLWFGFGCLCFLSSCFTKGVNFSIVAAISQLGLLLLGVSFFSNSILQRNNDEKLRDFMLKEDDILRLGRLILPATNLAISKARELFSGEPSMTLKVIPFLLLGAEYGHLITMRRLCGIGFFISFTVPKLYTSYSDQINIKAENTKNWLLEAWAGCSHKKVLVSSAVMAFWNLSSVKTRIFTAFISIVIIRCLLPKLEKAEAGQGDEEEQNQQALVEAEK